KRRSSAGRKAGWGARRAPRASTNTWKPSSSPLADSDVTLVCQEERMTAADLVRTDQEHLIHPLHHPVDSANTTIYVRGRGAIIEDIHGHEYIDGLSGLWNVNVGHGRAELAEVAAAQMKELACFSGFVGSSNIPAITLADRLLELADRSMQAVFLTSGGAEANESAFKTARFY